VCQVDALLAVQVFQHGIGIGGDLLRAQSADQRHGLWVVVIGNHLRARAVKQLRCHCQVSAVGESTGAVLDVVVDAECLLQEDDSPVRCRAGRATYARIGPSVVRNVIHSVLSSATGAAFRMMRLPRGSRAMSC